MSLSLSCVLISRGEPHQRNLYVQIKNQTNEDDDDNNPKKKKSQSITETQTSFTHTNTNAQLMFKNLYMTRWFLYIKCTNP